MVSVHVNKSTTSTITIISTIHCIVYRTDTFRIISIINLASLVYLHLEFMIEILVYFLAPSAFIFFTSFLFIRLELITFTHLLYALSNIVLESSALEYIRFVLWKEKNSFHVLESVSDASKACHDFIRKHMIHFMSYEKKHMNNAYYYVYYKNHCQSLECLQYKLCRPSYPSTFIINDAFMIYLVHQNLLYFSYPSRSSSLSISLVIIALCVLIAKEIIYIYIHLTYNKILSSFGICSIQYLHQQISWILFYTQLSCIVLLCVSEIMWNVFHLCMKNSDAFIGTWKNWIHFIMLLYYDIIVFGMQQCGWMCRGEIDLFLLHEEKPDSFYGLRKKWSNNLNCIHIQL